LYKFAHMSDIHLGAHPSVPEMEKREMEIFKEAIKKCISLNVDFILISGDFFDQGVPSLTVVMETASVLFNLKNLNIPVYVLYGSHDYRVGSTSVIDILDAGGLITKIPDPTAQDRGKFTLKFVEDTKTKAKITGLKARKQGIEKHYYDQIDISSAESETGFKIFAFHCGLDEYKPAHLSQMECTPLSSFPKDFNYYAGGHIHDADYTGKNGKYLDTVAGYDIVVFPGPLFTGHGFPDISETASGNKRGFFVINFTNTVEEVNFIEMECFNGEHVKINCDHKSIDSIKDELNEILDHDIHGKVFALELTGTLKTGKKSDLNITELKQKLSKKLPLAIYIHHKSLKSEEFSPVHTDTRNRSDIEKVSFKENLDNFNVPVDDLKKFGLVELIDKTSTFQSQLLGTLTQEILPNERIYDYNSRIRKELFEYLKIPFVEDDVNDT